MTHDRSALQEPVKALLKAIVHHVPFDGWSESSFSAAVRDSGLSFPVARGVCPRGALDLAVAFHREGDAEMERLLKRADLGSMKFRDKVAFAVRTRLELVTDKELVRRGSTLFALPQNAGEGAKAIWETADAIWTALGDKSDDINWYTKRGTLAGVYGATVLYWLGDDSPDNQRSWRFLDRRIADVMQIEKIKAQMNDSRILRPFLAGPLWAMGKVKAPVRMPRRDLPAVMRRAD